MQMCSRCKERFAVIFITKIDGNETKNEGLCLRCAKELGIKPLDDVLEKMGVSEEDLDHIESEMETMMENGLMNLPGTPEGDVEDARAPAIDFQKLFGPKGMMPRPPQGEKGKGAKGKGAKPQENKRKFIDTYCTSLTKEAAAGKLDRIVGRKRELDRVIQILCRRQKNNPCLIGEPGVGKTAIAEALAQKIVAGDVPYRLQGCEVCLVDLTALVAGTQFRGQFESRILGLLKEVKEAGNVILVIDEVHNIVGAGDAEGSMNAANILKPALSRGEIQIIGATTLSEYRKHIEKDSALERRFQPVTVNEPSIDECVEVLKGIKHYYEKYHGIRIPELVLYNAAVLSERYITDRYLPDKAIDLVDEASARLSLSTPEINERAALTDKKREIDAEYAKTEAEIPEAGENAEPLYKKMADLKAEQLRIERRLEELEPICAAVQMKVSDLADVIETWTGIPASSITENEFKKIDALEERLKTRIIGQDEAVSAIARAIRRNRAGVSYKRKPVSFIFAGPTGVGKTELVKTLADDLFQSPETLIRLDMSEFMEKHSVSRIIGAPPGYVGYDDAGQLTGKIRRRPYSVVLFDEIEKAHPDVMNILLQILDDGRITDAHGKQVNFENTVIVMTTNAGSTASSIAGFGDNPDASSREKTERALSAFLRPEFINRVDEVITFRSLNEEDFAEIAKIMLGDLQKTLKEKDITLMYTEEASRYIAKKSFSHKYGARNMRRFIQREVEDKIAEAVIARYDDPVKSIALGSDGESLMISCV